MELRLVGAAVVLLGSMASSVWAGEKAQPVSASTLDAMGLSRMHTLSAAEGAQVRGKFTFAWTFGVSSAGGNTQFHFSMNNPASGFRFVTGGGGGFAGGGSFSFSN